MHALRICLTILTLSLFSGCAATLDQKWAQHCETGKKDPSLYSSFTRELSCYAAGGNEEGVRYNFPRAFHYYTIGCSLTIADLKAKAFKGTKASSCRELWRKRHMLDENALKVATEAAILVHDYNRAGPKEDIDTEPGAIILYALNKDNFDKDYVRDQALGFCQWTWQYGDLEVCSLAKALGAEYDEKEVSSGYLEYRTRKAERDAESAARRERHEREMQASRDRMAQTIANGIAGLAQSAKTLNEIKGQKAGQATTPVGPTSAENMASQCKSQCPLPSSSATAQQRAFYEQAACMCKCMGDMNCYQQNMESARSFSSSAPNIR